MDLSELLLQEKSGMDPTLFHYYDQLDHRTIVLNDEIGFNFMENVIIPLRNFNLDGSNSPVNLIIQTPGGSITDSLILVNMIDSYSKPLNIYVMGYAYSMGTIIMAAGNNNPNVTKYCYSFSSFLLHCGSTGLFGSTSQVKDTLRFHEKIENRVKEYILSNTKISEEQYEYSTEHEWYFFADEAKELGLIDEII